MKYLNALFSIFLAALVKIRSPRPRGKTVILFNASTRLVGISLNAGFATITGWALRIAGVPVEHFVCNRGMSRCILGTNPDRPEDVPPCRKCTLQSRILTFGATRKYFKYQRDETLAAKIETKSVDELMDISCDDIPLGRLVLPSLRWRMRVHHLQDDETTRFIYREFILSALNIAREFSHLLDKADPRAVVLFNGQFFPEAVARFLALKRKVRVITHEVGIQPKSAYFTDGEATAYPIHIPESFEMNDEQNARLDAYLENRFQGKFSMAGIRFWPEIKELDEQFLEKVSQFNQIVPIFTNVVFDTSQPHSNTLFPDMFAWLEEVRGVIAQHPETLFVIRAHPDESRLGKASRETVADWVKHTGINSLANVVFIPPHKFISSYQLIQRAKFIMIYNSTIGLEASIMNVPVLCAGKARFTRYPTVFFPASQKEYCRQLEVFLQARTIRIPEEFQHNARRFFYYQLFRTSLPFNDFLEATKQRGYVRIKLDALKFLRPERSTAIRAVLNGILWDGNFLLEEK
jgi:hypothetical protein